jgi:predicted alpha/beta hydrolase
MPESVETGEVVAIDAEGAQLSGRFFPPQGRAKAHLLISGATGVPQHYYAAFAAWAAMQGVGVLTYDYRDFGQSRRRRLRASDATFADWAIRDQAAAEAKLVQLAPDGPLWLLGHSIGGVGIAFRNLHPRVARVTTIGAGHAHVADHPWRYLPLVLAFWFVVGPPAATLAGYLPGRALLLGADLPAGVYWQWRKWCTRRDFYGSDVGKTLPQPNYALNGAPLRMLSLSDDAAVTPAAVKRYAALFPENQIACRMLRPDQFGLRSLGHIEVFSRRNAAAWPAILDGSVSGEREAR